ncbi:MAG: TetR/AcrR family transcriptional regulator [Coriobacteriia bacterium]|nr:TetR/AcrR family transcriptional regulator [Coriobacteriia bacterium]MCL2749989.1 TetR/AcrR family transcriptional regulator [Coriobacteriia bacterium]
MPRSKESFNAMRESTKQKIEDAALSLFARKGLSVKVSEIAAAAGVSQGLLYSHYPSKDALIAGLVQKATEISSQSVEGISELEMPAAERIKQTTQMMCLMFTEAFEAVDYFMFMIQVGMSGSPLSGASLYPEDAPNPSESLAGILAQGQQEGTVVPGNTLQLATTYWAAIQGLCCYAITGMEVSPDPQMLNRILLKEGQL